MPFRMLDFAVIFTVLLSVTMEVTFNIGNDSVLTVTVDFPHESIAKDKSIFENLTKQFKEKYGHETDLGEELMKLKDYT